MNNEKLSGKLRPKLKLSAQLDRGTGSVTTFAGLSDVDLTDIQNNQLIKYDSESQKFINFTPDTFVQDVEVGGTSVVNAQGVAEITLPSVPVQDVEVGGVSVVNAQGVAEITIPSGSHNYSTTEQVVGTWTDGKSIYEKTYNNQSIAVSTSNIWTPTSISILNINKIINITAIDNAGQKYATSGGLGTGGAIFIALPTMGSARSIETVIIQYTKSTD